MPELDCISAFEHLVTKACQQHKQKYRTSLKARLRIHPRVFAMGTESKPWNSCFVHNFGYTDTLEAEQADFPVHPHNLRRCKGDNGVTWLRYIDRPLEEGELCVKGRGKELIVAAGYHAIHINFGLEGHLAYLTRDQYERVVAQDCPGSNKAKAKADKMRSFVVPSELTDPDARHLKKQQTMEMFASFVGEHDTFVVLDFARLVVVHIMSLDRQWSQDDLEPGSALWSAIWGEGYGPDWTHEHAQAEVSLDEWRSEVLASWPDARVPSRDALVEVICKQQGVFNGYGRHTAHDLLHHLGLWPGTPYLVLCSDEDLYHQFKILLHLYAAQFRSEQYQADCVGSPTALSPLAFNIRSNDNYINKYVLVYRKWEVRMEADLYNELYKQGVFDSKHTIG
ncbi:hypothetical protein C8T65DRAFT_742416 [Cerioporus squamosus]|nr:hypothetical protein C8T65DRAFT_742416 [Cerioporus squamosus]